ncbi:unnamed protein product [Arabidopsis thaliana]|uniref:Uncharacterized protein n=1 Tax=Arabidopsis thaliana TaxID=3702 RepID=A0A654ETK8_ARATH|nr:unnamed protein product [Arabidopsis thaliana]
MKVKVIFLASCVLFSLIHAHLSHEEPMKEPEYCRWTNAFNGTCSDRGNPQTMCFSDFLDAHTARVMPKNCACNDLSRNKRYCECLFVCNS